MQVPTWQKVRGESLRIAAIVFAAIAFVLASCAGSRSLAGDAEHVIDASTLRGKVMCGYQGWFRCPGDASKLGWIHYARGGKLTPTALTFEMWPDMRELGKDDRFPAPGFTLPDGSPAELFSSDNAATVERHFEWMRDYGIDGVYL